METLDEDADVTHFRQLMWRATTSVYAGVSFGVAKSRFGRYARCCRVVSDSRPEVTFGVNCAPSFHSVAASCMDRK